MGQLARERMRGRARVDHQGVAILKQPRGRPGDALLGVGVLDQPLAERRFGGGLRLLRSAMDPSQQAARVELGQIAPHRFAGDPEAGRNVLHLQLALLSGEFENRAAPLLRNHKIPCFMSVCPIKTVRGLVHKIGLAKIRGASLS